MIKLGGMSRALGAGNLVVGAAFMAAAAYIAMWSSAAGAPRTGTLLAAVPVLLAALSWVSGVGLLRRRKWAPPLTVVAGGVILAALGAAAYVYAGSGPVHWDGAVMLGAPAAYWLVCLTLVLLRREEMGG
jgi:hypothetical protein